MPDIMLLSSTSCRCYVAVFHRQHCYVYISHFRFRFSKKVPNLNFSENSKIRGEEKLILRAEITLPPHPGKIEFSTVQWWVSLIGRLQRFHVECQILSGFLSKVIVDNSIRHSRLRIIKPCTERFKPHIMAVVTEALVSYSPVAEGSVSYLLPLGRRYQPQIACWGRGFCLVLIAIVVEVLTSFACVVEVSASYYGLQGRYISLI